MRWVAVRGKFTDGVAVDEGESVRGEKGEDDEPAEGSVGSSLNDRGSKRGSVSAHVVSTCWRGMPSMPSILRGMKTVWGGRHATFP